MVQAQANIKNKLEAALYSKRMETFITLLIIVNAVVLAALTYRMDPLTAQSKISVLLSIDIAILMVFTIEVGLKLIVNPSRFFSSGWNIFDLIVVFISIFGASYPLTVLRSLRVLRVLRVVTHVPSMRVVVESFLKSIPGIGSVLMVMLLVLFVFSVIGTTLYKEISPELFGTLHVSAFTLFTVLTLEGWPEVARGVMQVQPWAWVFFVTYIAINSFAVLNLMIAVIIATMQKDYEAEAEEEREDIMQELRANEE